MWIYLTLVTPLLAFPALLTLDRLERWTTTAPPVLEAREPDPRAHRVDRARSVARSRRRDVVGTA